MRVCIPTMSNKGLDDTVGEHFGRVPTYTIVDSETNAVNVVENTSDHMGGQGHPPEIIKQAGADVMLCGGLGRRAIARFAEQQIEVFVGAVGTVAEAIEMWKAGKLTLADENTACRQHAFGGHGHGHEHGHGHGKGSNCGCH